MFQSGGKSECMWKLVWWTTTDIFNHISVYIYGIWIIGKRLSGKKAKYTTPMWCIMEIDPKQARHFFLFPLYSSVDSKATV